MLVAKDVKKAFIEPDGSRLEILDIPSFEVAEREQVVLIGESGCGKTTFLHVLSGISHVDSGSISIGGVDITGLHEAGRDRFRARNIGYVFQTFNLLPGFSALENVMLGMSFTGQRAESGRARDLLERVGLGHRMHHKPAALSVGEQQRVAVARSLANRPRLLLADEPTANVDRRNQQQMIELIRSTCEAENVALVLVTHTGEVAEQFERVEDLEQLNRVHQAA